MQIANSVLFVTALGFIALTGCSSSGNPDSTTANAAVVQTGDPADAADLPTASTGPSVGLDGQPLPPVTLTEAEWRAKLGPQAFNVLREEGTERAFTSPLNQEKGAGMFLCGGCQAPVFASATKFESGTGWPSFYEPFAPQNVTEIADNSYGMRRVEVECNRCGGHLGHVFDDGPQPTGLRYCINGAALQFAPAP